MMKKLLFLVLLFSVSMTSSSILRSEIIVIANEAVVQVDCDVYAEGFVQAVEDHRGKWSEKKRKQELENAKRWCQKKYNQNVELPRD